MLGGVDNFPDELRPYISDTDTGLGITFGPTISGWILSMSGWRYIFIVHAVALFIVLICSYSMPSDSKKDGHKKLDIMGITLFIISLLCLMLAITQGAQIGWLATGTILLFISGLILMGLFAFVEHHTQNPMVNVDLVCNKRFLGMILIPVVASLAFVTLLTYFPSYLMAVKGISPLHAGLVMITLTSPVLFLPIIAGKLVAKGVSPEILLKISLLLLVAGLALLWFTSSHTVGITITMSCLFLVGAGMGLSAGLVDGIALSIVDEQEVGRAAGILNTFRLGSEALAVAIYGSLLASGILQAFKSDDKILDIAKTRQFISQIISGNVVNNTNSSYYAGITEIYQQSFESTLLVLMIISLIVSIMIIRLIRKDKHTQL
jgi:predicted MFS family arabinose efflux permease